MEVTGLNKSSHKAEPYANDPIFYITFPINSIPVLLAEIDLYGTISDFTNKSEMMIIAITDSLDEQIKRNCPLTQHIRYQGTIIPENLK